MFNTPRGHGESPRGPAAKDGMKLFKLASHTPQLAQLGPPSIDTLFLDLECIHLGAGSGWKRQQDRSRAPAALT